MKTLLFTLLCASALAVSAQQVVRGPYLQRAAPTAIAIRWRTDVATDSRVRFGPSPAALTQTVQSAAATTEHEVALSGLLPATRYYYEAGSTAGGLASGTNVYFVTPPATTSAVRIWALGDSGTGDANQLAVLDGYRAFAGGHPADLMLALGDNAYDAGSDAEYTLHFFDPYADLFAHLPVWPTIGNHDTAQSINPPADLPYFLAFSPPTNAECGGIASGTIRYYSFNVANVHFVCLDSMTSSRTNGSPMLTWLQADLAAATQDWVVACFHHPPYSKGSHDSDTEATLVDMRTQVVPLLEAGGVDLVLSGHSHAYERSWPIDGHYGDSSTFEPLGMRLDDGDGRESGDGAYLKPRGRSAHQGTIYIVAGSGGQLGTWWGGYSAETSPVPHAVMGETHLRRGSLVIDVNRTRLDVNFVGTDGLAYDNFTVLKTLSNSPPAIALTSPTNGAIHPAYATIPLTVDASDPDGEVWRVDFYADGQYLTHSAIAPFTGTWNAAPPGTHLLQAVAWDDLGAPRVSAPVTFTVRPPPPSAPAGLVVRFFTRRAVWLAWTDTATNESSFSVERSVNGGAWTTLATLAANTTRYHDATLAPGTPVAYRVRAGNGDGVSPPSNTAATTTRR